MKIKLLSFLILLSGITTAQHDVTILELETVNMLYHAGNNRIYALTADSNLPNANSLVTINPETIEVENTVFIGNNPQVMTMSIDSTKIYLGFYSEPKIKTFDILNQEIESEFDLYIDDSDVCDNHYAEDIEVLPGSPNTLVVSERDACTSPRHETIAVYDSGVKRPGELESFLGSNVFEFTSDTILNPLIDQIPLVGFTNESTGSTIRYQHISSSGVVQTASWNNLVSSFSKDFFLLENKMYFAKGDVVDILSRPLVLGVYEGADGAHAHDSIGDFICFATRVFADNILFQRFDRENFSLVDSYSVPDVGGSSFKLLAFGEYTTCYAFNTSEDLLVFLKPNGEIEEEEEEENPNNILEEDSEGLSIYPNPAYDYLSFSNHEQIINVEILDQNGRIIQSHSSNFQKIAISDLAQGIYHCKVTTNAGYIASIKLHKH